MASVFSKEPKKLWVPKDKPRRMPTNAEILKFNKLLPEHMRQSAVFPHFRGSYKVSALEQFYEIHLTPWQMQKGGETFYMADINQPHNLGKRRCPNCYQPMRQLHVNAFKCDNPKCMQTHGPLAGKHGSEITVGTGPKRGVIRMLVTPDFVTDRDVEEFWMPVRDPTQPNGIGYVQKRDEVEYVDRIVVILDRQYPEITLASTYRSVGVICEKNGWQLK